MLNSLRREVCEANKALKEAGLVTLTWGNISGIDRKRGIVAIKPSGVDYAALTPDKIVLVRLDGGPVEEGLRPSTDLPSHLALYRAFPQIGGVAHTHSAHATMFAQARREIPCLGTTHADHFNGPVPVARPLTRKEIAGDYEAATGGVIVEQLAGTDPMLMPAALVPCHGPFTWGRDVQEALQNSIALEEVAKMALGTLGLDPFVAPIPACLLKKHFDRKHGGGAYYGQRH